MHPILFHLGGLSFYTHGMMAVLGIIFGSITAYYLARKKGLDTGVLFDNIVFTVLFGIIGARIAYYLLYRDQFSSTSSILFLWDGGLVSYGGFILGFITFVLLLRYQKQPVMRWLDVTSIGFFLALTIGRIGDIFAGEYAGIATQSKWLSIIPNNSLILVPFFEAVLCIIVFLIGLILYTRIYDRLKNGMIFFGSIILYTLGRFLIDFGRNEKELLWKISFGQMVSLIIFVIALIFLFRRGERSQNETQNEARQEVY